MGSRIAGGGVLTRDKPSGAFGMGLEVWSISKIGSQLAKAWFEKEGT